MKINSIRKVKNLANKTVFLRVDFNVPFSSGRIKEDYKIRVALASIEFLQDHRAKIIIATHLARPSSKSQLIYSTRPLARRLAQILKQKVKFLPGGINSATRQAIKRMKPREIVFLENLRFYSGEYQNSPKFAARLASLADLYVNDAFAVSHRFQASISAIKKFLPSYAGLLLEQEVKALNRILLPKKPLVIIMGGAKLETKLPLILKLYPRASWILIGGALANNFFKFQGLEIGRSLVADRDQKIVKKLFRRGKIVPKIILPRDLVVETKKHQTRVIKTTEVDASDTIFDIGPLTIADFATRIKTAATLVWNGPLGKFEEKSFRQGTVATATLIAARSSGRAYGLVGGGDTVEALKLTKMARYVDWISTAGGAMLTYLGGGLMPGLSKIVSK